MDAADVEEMPMSGEKSSEGIIFNNIRINSMVSGTGVFAGQNLQCLWCSDSRAQAGFGIVAGEGNSLESSCSAVTDPDSSRDLLEYFEELVKAKIGKRGI
jgi:hypothetical protein